MKRYRVNLPIVIRNITILLFLTVLILANKQLKDQEVQMQQLDEEIRMTRIVTKHSIKSVLNHKARTYTSQEEKTNLEYLGTFKITHYCACTKCCGQNAQGITASGAKVQEGVTIAVDRKVIPLGSKVCIDGYGDRIAQDTGSAIKGNRIDVYVNDHNRALQLGVVYKDVYLVKGV